MGVQGPGMVFESGWLTAQLSEEDFARLGAYVVERTGIRMPSTRRTMLEARLRTRLRALGLDDFGVYCQRALGAGGNADELAHIIDRATTNTTEFFREAPHFDYLVRHALPALRARPGPEQRVLNLWSAGCSTGEEPYTLAMVLAEAARTDPSLRYRILATDISREVLRRARQAVYAEASITGIPEALRPRYLLRSKARERPTTRIVPALRNLVTFQTLNLTDSDYQLPEAVDIIFCRNVFIYFERQMHGEILHRFARQLTPGGYLFLGHTDTIQGLDVALQTVTPSVYRKLERPAPPGRPT